MKLKPFLLLLFYFGYFNVGAQVNLQTGAAQYSIPLYSYSDPINRLSCGISLDYVTGNGLKVAEMASSVGTGWSLQFGGQITRILNGEPDDQKQNLPWNDSYNLYYNSPDYEQNYYPNGYLYSEFDPAILVTDGGSWNPLFATFREYRPPKKFLADREQDIFRFSFNGRSGEFIIGKNGTIKTLVDSKLKIEKVITDMTSNNIRTTISEFQITDENGIMYIFKDLELSEVLKYDKYINQNGTLVSTTYQTINVGRGLNQFVTSNWLLTEIKNPLTNSKITFSYETYNAQLSGNILYSKSYTSGSVAKYSLSLEKIKGKAKRIKSIQCSNKEKVKFVYANNFRHDLPYDKRLEFIEVLYNDEIKYKWNFLFGYFQGNIIEPVSLYSPVSSTSDRVMPYARLCLQSLQKIGNAGTKESPYKFKYYMEGFGVPAPFSDYRDHWGYSNGVGAEPAVNPAYILGMADAMQAQLNNSNFIHRQIADKQAQNGIIKTIEYPTGGSLTFEYEQNKVFNNGIQLSIGGVRVGKTIAFDGNNIGKNVINEYKYLTEDSTTSGWGYDQPIYQLSTPVRIWKCGDAKVAGINYGQVISSFPQFYNIAVKIAGETMAASTMGHILGTVGSLFAALALNFLITFLSDLLSPNYEDYTANNISSYAINYANPLPFQYSRVEVKSIQNATNNGKVIYEFTSPQHNNILIPTLSFPFSSQQRVAYWVYGLPKTIHIYDNENRLKKKTINEYQYHVNTIGDQNFISQKWVPHYREFDCFQSNGMLGFTTSGNITHAFYYPLYGRTELIETKEYNYNGNNESNVVTTNYEYSPNNFSVKKITTVNSKNELLEKDFYYATDYSATGFVQTLRNNNIVNTPIATYNYVNKNGNRYMLGGAISEFANISNGDIKLTKTHIFNNTAPV